MATEDNESDRYDVVSGTFPKEICYIDAQINSLFDINLNPGLISVNLHCNNISVIENLDGLKYLKHLDLSSNHITRMQGLGDVKSLKTLNLSCNELQTVEGLENLRYGLHQFGKECVCVEDGEGVTINRLASHPKGSRILLTVTCLKQAFVMNVCFKQ